MAKSTGSNLSFKATPKKKRSGIHSKKKRSVHKNGKNYVKSYRGQGK